MAAVISFYTSHKAFATMLTNSQVHLPVAEIFGYRYENLV